MRYAYLICIFLLSGCAGDRPPVAAAPTVLGPVSQAPPPSDGVSLAKETFIADSANAAALAAKAVSDHSAQEASDAKADAAAAKQGLDDQRKQEVNSKLARFYVLAVLAAAAAAVLGYLGNFKLAAPLGVGAGALAVAPSVVASILNHESLVTGITFLGCGAALLYHFRSKVAALVAELETHAVALEHTLSHIPVGTDLRIIASTVSSAAHTVEYKAGALIRAVLVKLHVVKPATIAPTVAPPIAPAPKV